MPFIIDHRSPALPPNHEVAIRAVPISSRAVATIEEARDHVYAAHEGLIEPEMSLPHVPETGGTIGPLPDGATIEVRPTTWSDLATDLALELRYDPPTIEGDYLHERQCDELTSLIDAYNAPGQVSPNGFGADTDPHSTAGDPDDTSAMCA